MVNGNKEIRYLQNKEIDKVKWDACITNADNGLVYAYSFYLDIMSKHWDALVMNDYEIIMPLTWNRKYGIYYLYQPFFCASLGIFGNKINADVVKKFLENVPKKFRYWDIYLNRGNVFAIQNYSLYVRSNFVLNLNKSYEDIVKSFSKNHIRNIKKAEQAGCYAEKNVPVENIIALAKDQSKKFSPVTNDDYNNFSNLYKYLHEKNMAVSYGVFNAQKQMVSSCVYFFSHKRAYYILVGNHPDGRTSGASHFLINAFIKDNAERDLILDFEGSEVRNLAYFYKSFGATEEKYSAIKLNKLPAIIRLFKK